MKKLISILIVLIAVQCYGQGNLDYGYVRVKMTLPPYSAIPEGATYFFKIPDGNYKVSLDNLRWIKSEPYIELKRTSKDPDVVFQNVVSVGIIEEKNFYTSENNLTYWYKKIRYAVEASMNFVDRNGKVFFSIPATSGKEEFSVNYSSTFFVQSGSDNVKYPKPADIPNAEPQMMPGGARTNPYAPVGFLTEEKLNASFEKYKNFAYARIEAQAIETMMNRNKLVLEGLFGQTRFNNIFSIAEMKSKGREANYDDLDVAADSLKAAIKLLISNPADMSVAYPSLKQVLNTFQNIQAKNEPRVQSPKVQSLLDYNIGLIYYLLGETENAETYFKKYQQNSAQWAAGISTINDLKSFFGARFAMKNKYPANLLNGIKN